MLGDSVLVNRERSWRRAGCPAGSSYPGGKERAGVCPHPRAGGDRGDIWDSHGTRGHSGMAPVTSEGISQSSQIPAAPWQCHGESKVLRGHSLRLPFPTFPSWDLSLLRIKPRHPSPPFPECWSRPLPVPCPGSGNGVTPAPRGMGIPVRGHEELRAGCDSLKPPQEARAAAERAVHPQSHSWANVWPPDVLCVPHLCPICV